MLASKVINTQEVDAAVTDTRFTDGRVADTIVAINLAECTPDRSFHGQ